MTSIAFTGMVIILVYNYWQAELPAVYLIISHPWVGVVLVKSCTVWNKALQNANFEAEARTFFLGHYVPFATETEVEARTFFYVPLRLRLGLRLGLSFRLRLRLGLSFVGTVCPIGTVAEAEVEARAFFLGQYVPFGPHLV